MSGGTLFVAMAPELTLYAESSWMSPWVFHALVALEEKRLTYKLEVLPLPLTDALKAKLAAKAILGKVPVLVHGEAWISESSAISEYLAEQFRRRRAIPGCSHPTSSNAPVHGR